MGPGTGPVQISPSDEKELQPWKCVSLSLRFIPTAV